MIRVLVVEDEFPTARVIGRLVNQHPSFTVVGMEGDGECALQFLQANSVDLVITDIEMPVMNGLKLLEAIQRDFPQCIVVMLTGFSYFEYARTALQHRAFDYVLKPIDTQEFFNLLNRVEIFWKKQTHAQEHQLLGQALSGIKTVKNAEKYHMLLAVAHRSFGSNPEQSIWQQWLGSQSHVFNSDLDTERIVILEASKWNAEQIEQYYHQFIEPSIDAIYSVDPVSLAELSQTAKRLRMELEQRLQLFCGNLIAANVSRPLVFRRDKQLQEMYPERAVEAICAQNKSDLKSCLSQMWKAVEHSGSFRCDVYAYFDSILIDRRIVNQTTPEKLRQTKQRLWELIDTSPDSESSTNQMIECLLALLQETSSKRNVSERVEEIAFYIDTNYHMPITVEGLCKQFGFVPRHLNKIFKKYKGVRPTEYLLNLRMQKAKRMLETMPDALVKDVAASVGYSDHHYFSTVFHRATGLWPTEVQQKSS